MTVPALVCDSLDRQWGLSPVCARSSEKKSRSRAPVSCTSRISHPHTLASPSVPTSSLLFRRTLVLAIALALPIVPFLVIGELPGDRWLSATDQSAPVFALTGGGLLVLDVIAPVPSSIVITLLGGRLGWLVGWLVAWGGLTAGHLLGYGIGRLWPARFAPDAPDAPTLAVLVISRPVPILAEAAAIAAGAARTPFGHVALAVAAGNVIYAGVLAANGAALIAGDMAGLGVVLPLLVPVAGWALWRYRTRVAVNDGKETGAD